MNAVPGVRRTSLPDGYFHAFARGACDIGPIFRDDPDREAFLDLLTRATTRHGIVCHAFCLMSTHYHLIVETSRAGLSAGLGWLNWSYAMQFNRRHGRFGHLFAERFSSRVIRSDEYLYDVCAYVLLNPVNAGLCDTVEGWPWSWSRLGIT